MLARLQVENLAEAIHNCPNRIQGFNYERRQKPFVIRDVWRKEDQTIWEGTDKEEFEKQLRYFNLKLALEIAGIEVRAL